MTGFAISAVLGCTGINPPPTTGAQARRRESGWLRAGTTVTMALSSISTTSGADSRLKQSSVPLRHNVECSADRAGLGR